MKKGKRMNKIIPIIATLTVVVVGAVVFIQTRPKQILVGAAELEKMPVKVEAPERKKMPINAREPEQEKMPIGEEADETGIGEAEETMGNQEYVENQVVAVAESKREAKKIAKQIGGELISYDNQVAVIQIGMTVEEMMQQLEEDSSLPKVYPNYQGYQNFTN